MTEHKTPVDQMIDLLVYAPLGFALDARSLLPKLIDRGRDQVSNQVTMARFIGRFATKQGQSEAGKRLAKVQEQATTTLADLGLLPRRDGQSARTDRLRAAVPATLVADAPSPPSAAAGKLTNSTTSARPTPARTAKLAGRTKPKPVITAAGLAIPDYDSLAASQVIPRLAGLGASELEAARIYEAGHRGRKTILNKIAQLQA